MHYASSLSVVEGVISPALKEFKPRSEQLSEECSKMGICGRGNTLGRLPLLVRGPLRSPPRKIRQSESLRGTSALPCGPHQSGSGPGMARTSSARPRPEGRPPPRLPPGARPPPRPSPLPPTFPPPYRLLAPATLHPPTLGQWRAPPAARPGLRPLALSPTCLCYSSSLPCLASNITAVCKTRSAEPPPHLDSKTGSRPKPPPPIREGSECGHVCPTPSAKIGTGGAADQRRGALRRGCGRSVWV
jgi:hypothetical protein